MKQLLLGIACVLLSATSAFAEEIGVLVLAHGGSARWNRTVEQTVRNAGLKQPTEIAFGMGMHPPEVEAIQRAVDYLERKEVSRIIAVPFLVSSASDVMRQYEYLLGLRKQGPWEEHVKPVAVHAPVTMAEPLDDDQLVAEVLQERAQALSRQPEQEAVVLIAHGPVSEEDNHQWLATMTHLAEQIQTQTNFRAIIPVTMRDDAPEAIREEAIRHMREVVEQESQQGRVLVVPLLLAEGGIERKISMRLKGLRYVFRGKTLLPHPKLSEWVAQRVEAAMGQERTQASAKRLVVIK